VNDNYTKIMILDKLSLYILNLLELNIYNCHYLICPCSYLNKHLDWTIGFHAVSLLTLKAQPIFIYFCLLHFPLSPVKQPVSILQRFRSHLILISISLHFIKTLLSARLSTKCVFLKNIEIELFGRQASRSTRVCVNI
jgi:hypothetical protein